MDSLARRASLVAMASVLASAGLVSGESAEAIAPRAVVSSQAGVLEGANPVTYQKSNPIQLFIIQATIIIVFCRILHLPLSYLNQPRVIAEVIGGILLGPSVMMRIPGFQQSIFPTESMPVLSNVANLGLIIFLFLVALELDVRLFTKNWKIAVSVGFAGMALPFALGVAIAWGLYNQFRTDEGITDISFGVYALFVGTALAITAFPVLCRILTELNLLGSSVGVTVLAAGIGNDVTGWILLALCVALVNNANGLAALWALLCTVGWTLFLCFAVRPCFIWCLRKTGSLKNGPTQGMVALTLLIALISAWFTGIIGVHPIFGAFLAGLICPHEGGFAIKFTEKVEDLVSVLFLPLYFALSGLSTNLGLLNDGITWAYVIGVIAVAFAGKIIGGTLAAKCNKLEWRESFTIGCLMSCKGLVELIVLNIGLQAKILSDRTFTIFVVMALVTTVATTPLTKWLYPPWYQTKMEKWRRGETDKDGNPTDASLAQGEYAEKINSTQIRRLLIHLRLDSLPSLFTFVALLGAGSGDQDAADEDKDNDTKGFKEEQPSGAPSAKRPLEVHGLRMLELSERISSVMQVTEAEEYYSERDPVVNAFRAFSRLNDVAVSGKVAVVPTASYAETLTKQAADVASDFVLVPWGEYGSLTEETSVLDVPSSQERFAGRAHLDFVAHVLRHSVCNTGIFINQGFGGPSATPSRPGLRPRTRSVHSVHSQSSRDPAATALALPLRDKTHRVFLPFFGGVDDRVALRFALRLARNPNVTLTVVHLSWPGTDDSGDDDDSSGAGGGDGSSISAAGPSPAGAADNKETKGAVEVVDKTTTSTARDAALLATLGRAPPRDLAGRVTVSEISVASSAAAAVAEAVSRARALVGQAPRNAGDIIVVGRAHRGLGDDAAEVGGGGSGGELRRTVGVVAEQMVDSGVRASVLVVKAGGAGLHW